MTFGTIDCKLRRTTQLQFLPHSAPKLQGHITFMFSKRSIELSVDNHIGHTTAALYLYDSVARHVYLKCNLANLSGD